MTPKEISEKFAHTLDQFDPISWQPPDSDLTRIREAVAPLLLQIPYDETSTAHNIIGLIQPEAVYVVRYGSTFPKTARVGAYNPSIDDNAIAVVRAHTEAAQKAKRTYRATYETVRQKMAQFVIAVVADTWIREFQDTETIYTKVAPKDLLSHLQLRCTGRHALDLLALHN